MQHRYGAKHIACGNIDRDANHATRARIPDIDTGRSESGAVCVRRIGRIKSHTYRVR